MNLQNGDAFEFLRAQPDKAFDVMICDPPYDARVHRNGFVSLTKGKKVERKEINFEAFSRVDVETLVYESLRTTRRWVVIFCSLEQLGIYREFAGDEGFASGVYRKCNATPQLAGNGPANSCEGVAILHRRGRKRWNGGGSHAFWQSARDDSVEKIVATPKPVALMRQLVELFSDPGELVCDPFMGGGTTGVAALELGRNFVGVERNPDTFTRAKERLEAASMGQTVWQYRAKQQRLF